MPVPAEPRRAFAGAEKIERGLYTFGGYEIREFGRNEWIVTRGDPPTVQEIAGVWDFWSLGAAVAAIRERAQLASRAGTADS